MTIAEVLKGLNRGQLIRNLVMIKGHKKNTVETAFSRGKISKKLAPDLEELTSISALFWMRPDLYKKNGDRIK